MEMWVTKGSGVYGLRGTLLLPEERADAGLGQPDWGALPAEANHGLLVKCVNVTRIEEGKKGVGEELREGDDMEREMEMEGEIGRKGHTALMPKERRDVVVLLSCSRVVGEHVLLIDASPPSKQLFKSDLCIRTTQMFQGGRDLERKEIAMRERQTDRNQWAEGGRRQDSDGRCQACDFTTDRSKSGRSEAATRF
ncbi:hypothetical protein BDQ17DRAFT_1334578 [Cyathus striatus]|nr:hypothetical protein BDQ17DRAFT_1334578 [Cyathus striatus]